MYFPFCSGRIIVPVYWRVGRRDFVPEKSHFFDVVRHGDNWALSGSHSYEPAPFVSFVYYSDDEGKTWQRNAHGEISREYDDATSRIPSRFDSFHESKSRFH